MFCWKCGKAIADGEELCQDCRQQDSSVSTAMKQRIQEEKEKWEKTGGEIWDNSMKEFQKGLQKKAKQATRKVMKAVGLKKKTPLDKAKDMWKEIKR